MGFGSQEDWVQFNVSFPMFVEKHAALEALRDKMVRPENLPEASR